MQWYILRVRSNQEKKEKEKILRRANSLGLSEYFGKIIISKDVHVNGQEQVTYPGSLFIQMDVNERSIEALGDFLVNRLNRIPISDSKIIESYISKNGKDFTIGQNVRVVGGFYKDSQGVIEKLEPFTVKLHLFGKPYLVKIKRKEVELC